ncbi:patatin-like phospholipase family protein [Pseudomonas silesiensis]|uniref:patatin-like phospholipase family protein n=1 Tax=Pseudomonas silesiensis TaxID=1853130 RepID=UPI0034D61166
MTEIGTRFFGSFQRSSYAPMKMVGSTKSKYPVRKGLFSRIECDMNRNFSLPLALLAATLSGCHHQVKPDYLISDSDYYSRPHLDELFKAEHQVRKAPPLLGVALAGGGTKAASFSMGVLDGLNEKGMLKDVDIISTVSGGGYTGYWFFSRLTAYEPDIDIQKPVTTEGLNTFFEDCLPEFMVSKANSLQGQKFKIKPLCPSPDKDGPPDYTNYLPPTATEPGNGDIYRYQNYLRGYQDPFTTSRNLWERTSFNYTTTGQDHSFWYALPDNLLLITGSALVNVVPNILFDWGVDVSSSKSTYIDGIARTYGAVPPRCKSGGCPYTKQGRIRLEGDIGIAKAMTFSNLRDAYENRGAPLWVINATAGENRSPWDFGKQLDMNLSVYEITPYGMGSGLYWYDQSLKNITPFTAAMASAAFFDSQQKVVLDPGLRNIAAFGMKASTLSWGYSFRNPHISDQSFNFHMVLPWPFYYAHRFFPSRDQAWIHLSDGGMSENLGAYALIRRGVPSIIISDHAQDRTGSMGDICRLKTQLATLNMALQIPGLDGLAQHCNEGSDAKTGYDIFDWKHPVIFGCIFQSPNGAEEKNNPCQGRPGTWRPGEHGENPYFARVFLIKPALANEELEASIRTLARMCRSHYGKDCQNQLVELCQSQAKGITPNTQTPWTAADTQSCEMLGFLMNNSFGHADAKDGCPFYPQHSTINVTLNSSPMIYGAMRDLASYYTRQIKWFFPEGKEVNVDRFHVGIAYQDKNRTELKEYSHFRWRKLKAGGNSCLDLGRYMDPPG